jgi:hypothetical protein
MEEIDCCRRQRMNYIALIYYNIALTFSRLSMHVLRKREATSLHLIATPSAPVREEDIFAMLMTAVQARRAVYNTVICKAVGSVFL